MTQLHLSSFDAVVESLAVPEPRGRSRQARIFGREP
jgi:hypothetical protein